MNKFVMSAIVVIVSLATSGCATSLWELRYGKDKPPISYTFLQDVGKRDGIYAWRPDTAAAVSLAVYVRDEKGNVVVYQKDGKSVPLYEQKTCVMSAAAIKARDSEGGFNLSITTPESATGGELGAITRELQKITVLSSKSEAATFLDVALFGICMASMNGYVDQAEAQALIQDAITQAAGIASAAEQTKTQALAAGSDQALPPLAPIGPGKPTVKPTDPGIPKKPVTKAPKPMPTPAPEDAAPEGVDVQKEEERPGVAPGSEGTKSSQ